MSLHPGAQNPLSSEESQAVGRGGGDRPRIQPSPQACPRGSEPIAWCPSSHWVYQVLRFRSWIWPPVHRVPPRRPGERWGLARCPASHQSIPLPDHRVQFSSLVPGSFGTPCPVLPLPRIFWDSVPCASSAQPPTFNVGFLPESKLHSVHYIFFRQRKCYLFVIRHECPLCFSLAE